jgi:hypothetical protein
MYTVQLNPNVFNTVSSPIPSFLTVPEAYRNNLRVPLDTMDGTPANNEWYPAPVPRGPAWAPIVRNRRCLYVGVQPLQLMDSLVETGWTGNSYVARMLAHYVDTQLILVKKDGSVVASSTLRTYTKDA